MCQISLQSNASLRTLHDFVYYLKEVYGHCSSAEVQGTDITVQELRSYMLENLHY